MMFLLVMWTTTQGDWTIALTGGPLWSYFSTRSMGGLVPYTYTYTTSRFTGSLGWRAHALDDTLEGQWQMDPTPSGVSQFWLRYARGPFEMRAGDLMQGDWTLPVRYPRVQGGMVRVRESTLTAEALWFFPHGEVHLDRIQGQNSQGPYRLSKTPLLPGSEEVFLIQEGERVKLVRGKDYDVDYWVGEVVLLERVLYPEDVLEVRYVVAGEGEGLRAGGLRLRRGRMEVAGGAWQSYTAGGIRGEPGGYVETGLNFPFGEVRGQVVGLERQGMIYGAGDSRVSAGGYAGEISGQWRPRAVSLPGEGPIQIQERFETRQAFHWKAVSAGGRYVEEKGLQTVWSVEGWVSGRRGDGEVRLSGVRREVMGSSFREGFRLDTRWGPWGVWVARYRGAYPARGIREGAWWEGGGEVRGTWKEIRMGFSLHSEVQGSSHQETFQAHADLRGHLLKVRTEGRRTFDGLWLVTLSGQHTLQGENVGLSLDFSRTFRSDQYLLAPSSFWRLGGRVWGRWGGMEAQAGGMFQQGERVVTDTGGLLSRTGQIWAGGRGRGRWGWVEGLATWNRSHTLIPVEGQVEHRGGRIRWEKSLRAWQLVATGEGGVWDGWSKEGYARNQRHNRIEMGVDRQGTWVRQGVRGVWAESLVVDTVRFSRSYRGIALPAQVRWRTVDLRITPEAGKGSGRWGEERGQGWVFRMEIRAGVAGRWGQVWSSMGEEMTTFGLYRLRRLQIGAEIRFHLLRAGGMVLWEKDLLRGGEIRSLQLQVGGVF